MITEAAHIPSRLLPVSRLYTMRSPFDKDTNTLLSKYLKINNNNSQHFTFQNICMALYGMGNTIVNL